MSNKIKPLRNNDENVLSDIELIYGLYNYLQEELKLPKKRAFSVIWYLQEQLPLLPDHIEQCSVCGELYDSYAQGHHSELTGKFYCSESCEPPRLYEREQRWEIKKDAPFQKWLKLVKKEQKQYPALKGEEISETYLRKYFADNITPIDALNDILTCI